MTTTDHFLEMASKALFFAWLHNRPPYFCDCNRCRGGLSSEQLDKLSDIARQLQDLSWSIDPKPSDPQTLQTRAEQVFPIPRPEDIEAYDRYKAAQR